MKRCLIWCRLTHALPAAPWGPFRDLQTAWTCGRFIPAHRAVCVDMKTSPPTPRGLLKKGICTIGRRARMRSS